MVRKHQGAVRGYFGFDESNHGRTPEILVLTYTRKKGMTINSNGSYEKLTGDNNILRVYATNSELDFRFMVLPTRELTSLFDNAQTKAKIIKNLALDFNLEDLSESLFILDGEQSKDMGHKFVNEMNQNGFTKPERVICEARADRNYGIVNAADALARYLYHQHNKRGDKGFDCFRKKQVSYHFLEEFL